MISALLIFAAISCLFLGILVLSQGVAKVTNILFSSICLCFTVWSLSILVFLNADTAITAFISAKVFYVAAAVFPPLLLLFVSIFPIGGDFSRITKILVGITGIAMVTAIAVEPSFVTGSIIISENYNYIVVDPATYLLYSIYFLAIFSTGILLAIRKYFRLKGTLRMQAGLYAFGILLNSIPGTISNLILPAFGEYHFIWVGPVASVFFLGFASYSIVRHSLFDIRLAAVRTAAYALALVSLSALYYIVAYLASTLLFNSQTSSSVSVNPVNIFLALVLAFAFQPIKAFFDRATDRIFFRDRYNSEEFYARLSEVLTTTTDLRNLLQRAAVEIGATVKSEQAFFFLQYGEGKRHITAGTRNHKDLPLNDIDAINVHVHSSGDGILITQLLENNSQLKRVLISHKVALLMPLMHHDRAVGYLALGEQKSSGYTNRDIKVLKTISDELIIAIQNALSVQEVRVINASLEQRIEMATAELRTSNARLKRLDASKDEFLSMASHQLRTPLTSVKGYLSMMIDGDVGKISSMQKQVLEEAFSSSERMVHLIHDFLNVSRLQTGKFMLELSDVDLAELIQQEVKSLEKVASSHSMKLEFTNTAGDIHLQIDDTKIRQVVMNYIDNAIYYSHPDSTIAIVLSKTDKDVVLEIKDTGIGVPKNEQEQLFSKFYRASNARKQRPDGTGVGIFLAKKVVTALGGDIVFRSKEGKGSVFGFTLPLDQDQALLENNPKQLGK